MPVGGPPEKPVDNPLRAAEGGDGEDREDPGHAQVAESEDGPVSHVCTRLPLPGTSTFAAAFSTTLLLPPLVSIKKAAASVASYTPLTKSTDTALVLVCRGEEAQ